MIRGYSTSRDVVPNFLQAFDVDDGRAPCPVRTRTVTAPQALFLMNSDVIDGAADEVRRAAEAGVRRRPRRGGRPRLPDRPSPAPRRRRSASVALAYLRGRPGPAEGPRLAAVQPGRVPLREVIRHERSPPLPLRPGLPARVPPPGRRRLLRRRDGRRSGPRRARSRTRLHGPHFPPRAKSVIFLFMCGGVSHIDTFDPKDNKWAGKLIDAVGFGDNNAEMRRPVIPCRRTFTRHGQVGHPGLRLVPPRRRRDR